MHICIYALNTTTKVLVFKWLHQLQAGHACGGGGGGRCRHTLHRCCLADFTGDFMSRSHLDFMQRNPMCLADFCWETNQQKELPTHVSRNFALGIHGKIPRKTYHGLNPYHCLEVGSCQNTVNSGSSRVDKGPLLKKWSLFSYRF